MKQILYLITVFSLLLSWDSYAQTRPEGKMTVTGTVISSADNLPIIGATVYQKGNLSNGVVTDLDGNFSIDVPSGAVLVVSSMGYQTKEVAPSAKLRIVLDDESQQLDAVVFVGYGVQRKESVVGAISQVNNEALVNSGTTNITQAIAGKLSGVLAMQSSGTPGANDATIVIRGVSSWNGSEPLVCHQSRSWPCCLLRPRASPQS